MNILHVKYAVEVARLGSLNKAAESLMIAQPNISRSIKELAARANAAQEALALKLGREAGVAEIAAQIGAESADVALAMDAMRPHISIHEKAYGDQSEACLEDRLTDGGDEAVTALNRVLLKELLRTLEPRERQIIMLRYFSDRTQSEIAKLLGVSQVQVSRLENKILQKLRERAKENSA